MDQTTLRLAKDFTGKSLPRRLNFTVKALERLACPPGKDRLYVYDAKVPGLAHVVTSSGARAFYIVRKIARRMQRVRLGGAELTVEQARRMATKMNGAIADGHNPAEDRRHTRRSGTLAELWASYLDDHLEPRCSPRTIIGNKSLYATCLENWGNRKILDIKEGDVRRLHADIGAERGHTTANRAVELLRAMYGFAHCGYTPVGRGAVNMFRERSRERFVQPDELPRLFAALDDPATSPAIRDFVYLSLYTGARRSNVAAMRDEEINLAAATWIIPAGKSKSGETMTIPLSPPALEIIRRRIGHPSGYVFPGGGKAGHLTEPRRGWTDVLERAGLEDLHLHDLRRTLGSYQAALGASLPIIGRSLGHRDTSATEVYSRLNLDPVRASVNAAAAAIGEAAKVKGKAESK